MWKIFEVKEMLSEKLKNPSFQFAKSVVENRLRLPKQKYRVRDAAALVGFSIPTEFNVTPRPTVSSHQTRCRICKKQTQSRWDDCGRGVCPQDRKIIKTFKCEFCEWFGSATDCLNFFRLFLFSVC